MALVDLIVRKVTRAKVGVVQFDCSLSETHTGEATITDHPVESGVNISDHIRPNPKAVEINGIVSDTPLYFLASLSAPSPLENDLTPITDRANAAYLELERLKDNGIPVDVVTSLRDYYNMAITSLVVNRDQETGAVLNCTVSLREIIVAQTETEQLPDPVNVGDKKVVNKGKKVKKDADVKQEEKSQSVLISMGKGVGVLQ